MHLCTFRSTLRPPERTTPWWALYVCVSVHVYISVHGFRSAYRTKAQRSKWISASFHSMTSSTKANIASIFHTSLSIFFRVPSVPHPSHVHSHIQHINTQTNLAHIHAQIVSIRIPNLNIFLSTFHKNKL